jgi:hypothetical protein
MHLRSLAQAPFDDQRERSLARLAKRGDLNAVPILLLGLEDSSPRVRDHARDLLGTLEGVIVYDQLRAGYDGAKPIVKPLILEALAKIDADATSDLIDGATSASDPDLRIVAVGISGRVDPALEADYRARASSDESLVRGAAFRAYLALATKHRDEGRIEKASGMFSDAFGFAQGGSEREAALRGLIAVGDPGSFDRIAEAFADPALASIAAEGFVDLAAKLATAGRGDEAADRLGKIISGQFPLPIVIRAAEILKSLGRDPRASALAKGFLLDWWLVGPILDTDGSGMATKYFAEERIQFDEIERIGARRYRWKRLERLCLDGRVDLSLEFRRSQNVIAYGYTELESPSDRAVVLRFGSDDGAAIWVNGERLLFAPGSRSYKADQDAVEARLRAGKNKILVKVQQGDGDWVFSLRVTDADGVPVAGEQR